MFQNKTEIQGRVNIISLTSFRNIWQSKTLKLASSELFKYIVSLSRAYLSILLDLFYRFFSKYSVILSVRLELTSRF